MARPFRTLRPLATSHTTRTLKATLLAAAVATLAACSDPMGPTPVDADRPVTGGASSIDPDAPADAPSFGGATTSIDPGNY